jgi:hypothetical protein
MEETARDYFSRAIQDSAPHSCPCVILERLEDSPASTSPSPERSRRGRIPGLFLPLALKGRGSKVRVRIPRAILSRATQDSAPHSCPCVILERLEDNPASTSRSPERSRRGRIPALFLPLALKGRGSKVRVRIPRAIHFARDSRFCSAFLSLCHSERSEESRFFFFASPYEGEADARLRASGERQPQARWLTSEAIRPSMHAERENVC